MNLRINKSDIIILGIYFLVSFIMQGFDYYEKNSLLREYLFDFPAELLTTCTIIYLYIFWLIPRFIISKRYVLFTFLGLVILVFFASIEHLVGFWSGDNDWNKFPKGWGYISDMINRGSNNCGFPFALLLTKKFYEGQTEYLKIEKQQKENELKLLRSQIDPHFLFNNLNTLDALIDSDPEKAKEYINRLSLIYRYLIKTKDSEVMELSEELRFAKNYIFLIKTRFGNDYEFVLEKKVIKENTFLPTGAIQALLENVVKHNKKELVPVKTIISIEDAYLKVVNTKSVKASNDESSGTGLENLKSRYKYLSDKKISVRSSENEFRISIPIINLSE